MRTVLLCTMVALGTFAAVGCDTGGGPSASQKQFADLYRQYSSRFHEKMVMQVGSMTPAQVYADAARLWEEVFGTHKTLVTERVTEILKELPDASPIDESLYQEVAKITRSDPPPDQPKGIILRQFFWSPIGTAQWHLNNMVSRVLNPASQNARRVLLSNAGLAWEAMDRNISRPKLVQRQGPMVFVAEVSRVDDDYYQLEQVRWLWPKAMGPIRVTPATPTGTAGPGTTEGTAATGTTEGTAGTEAVDVPTTPPDPADTPKG